MPTLEELGIERPHQTSGILFPGGETEALRRLNEHMEKEVKFCGELLIIVRKEKSI